MKKNIRFIAEDRCRQWGNAHGRGGVFMISGD